MIRRGDCKDILLTLNDDSIDALITDPPAGISFMGKDWDGDKGGRVAWVAWMTQVMRESLRVMKPGAHGLVWALPRTSHWTATALEDAGFEIRDVVTHLFGTGFPKSLDVSKAIDKAAGAERPVIGKIAAPASTKRVQTMGRPEHSGSGWNEAPDLTAPSTYAAKLWQGWGTALKPASEHWILVRKPCSEKTVAANVLKWGTGAINVDGCRIAGHKPQTTQGGRSIRGNAFNGNPDAEMRQVLSDNSQGRFPANLVLDEDAAAMLDEQSGYLHARGNKTVKDHGANYAASSYAFGGKETGFAGDSGGASRFFYVAKASKSDRGEGNTHPTVKSTALMRYLCRLITPPGGLVLDPFAGSGSTGVAALAEGFKFVGIEQDAGYAAIAERRMEAISV
jgi:DNA modification methylase